MTDLREQIARELCEEAFKGHTRVHPIFMDEAEEKQFLRYADRILAIPEIAEALSITIPGEWPLEGDYGRGWNDCRRHAKAIIVTAPSP